jgi:crotonobetaine/carnitine-CoA ligase
VQPRVALGPPLRGCEVRVVTDDGSVAGPSVVGELEIRGDSVTSRYRTAEGFEPARDEDGWLRTGDLGYADGDGFFYFAGRKKDSLRRRGENISAWEVERVLNEHPAVAESAVIGVDNEIADQDLKAFLRLKPGERLDAADLVQWCEPRMAAFQIPRFIAFIEDFPKTPTERIRKELLPRSTQDCFDREKLRSL